MKQPQKSVRKIADKEGSAKQFSGLNQKLSYLLGENVAWMKEAFGASTDFIVREFKIGETNAALCFFDGLTDKRLLDEDVLKPLAKFRGRLYSGYRRASFGGRRGKRKQLLKRSGQRCLGR